MPDALESHETPKNIKIIERTFALEIKIASVLEKNKKYSILFSFAPFFSKPK